jgi:phage major head subunit gpT-like protein
LFCGDVPELRDDQKAKLQAAYDAEVKAAAAKPIIEGAAKAAVEAPAFDLSGVIRAYEIHTATIEAQASTYVGKIEAAALADIRAKAGTAAADLKLKALNEQWAPARLEVALVKAQAEAEVAMIRAERPAEVAMIRAERPKGPGIHPSGRDVSGDVIEAAFSKTLRLQSREKDYQPAVLEASDKLRGYGLGEVLLHHAVQAGYAGRMRITEGNLREVLKAAFSTHTLTTMLTNLGHKMLLEGFNAIPQSWRDVAQIRSVNDFKTWTLFRMTADLEFKEVGPGGEIQHGTLGQESYTMQAKTYARMLALTRQDIINDDLGAFNDIRNRLGIGGAIALNKAFWTAWTAAYNGAAFWTAARGNLVTGAALGETGMGKAVKAFRALAGPDGNMMNLQPDRILIPPDLEVTGRKLYVSQEQRDTTASTKFPTSNIYFNQFRPVVVPELGNSAYTGYSATTWYMLANPAVLASGLVCFLNGQESPTIESADADFDTLGIQFRSYTDFGVGMSEYRASVAAEA